jgi:hypothetical protein
MDCLAGGRRRSMSRQRKWVLGRSVFLPESRLKRRQEAMAVSFSRQTARPGVGRRLRFTGSGESNAHNRALRCGLAQRPFYSPKRPSTLTGSPMFAAVLGEQNFLVNKIS